MDTTFKFRDLFALAIMPFLFFLDRLLALTPLKGDATLTLIANIAIRLLLIVLLLGMYRDVLKKQWVLFRKKPWLKLLAIAAGTALVFAILYAVRLALPLLGSVPTTTYGGEEQSLSSALMIASSLIPLAAAFQEEIIFRHVLFYKFRESRGKWILVPLMFLLSSFLFGAIHFTNFGGSLFLTIPYMVLGAYFALIYFLTKNIWYSIAIHFTFNFVNSLLPALFVVFMQNFIVQ
jgi:membrane protease YdiL (CAAX protease family)